MRGLFAKLMGRRVGGGVKPGVSGVIVHPVPDGSIIVEEYWVFKPHAKVVVAEDALGRLRYYAVEDELSPDERLLFRKLLSFMEREVDPPEGEVDRGDYVVLKADSIISRYRRLRPKSEESKSRVLYYVRRELAGFGCIHPIMLDPNVEDVSCNGVGSPIYVYHRAYGSLPTNIEFGDENALNDFILRLAHMSGRHISTASPILDATLPGKHRLAATFMREVSNRGSTFCIRKFRERPFSVAELVKTGTLDEMVAAYLWLLVENRMSLMIMGGTGAGKTTMLNACIGFVRPEMKIVTVEETAEINIPHENWVPLTAREGFSFTGTAARSISLFDLVRTSLRYRPDYLIVGEIRGEEAYVLFQALATGHGGMSTMHADSIDYAVKRLTSHPMNISKVYLPLMNAWMHVERVTILQRGVLKTVRRVRYVWEMGDDGDYRVIAEWLPDRDVFVLNPEKSILLPKISRRLGVPVSRLILELESRAKYLRGLVESGILSYHSVVESVRSYYAKQVEAPEGLKTEAQVAGGGF